jgi:dienelactone hydrolase
MGRRLAAGCAVAIALAAAGCGGGGGSGPVRLAVTPRDALLDAPLTISASGLDPGSKTVLRASWRSVGGPDWASSTPETADAHGRLTLRGAAALDVVLRMRPPRAESFQHPYFAVAIDRPAPLRVALGSARATVLRRGATPGLHAKVLTVAHDGLAGYFYTPGGSRRRSALLVAGGSEGGISGIQEAALLASHGHPALALGYFEEPGLPGRLGNIRLEYFARALRWLGRQPGVDPHRLAMSGVSRGSEAALLMGADFPQLVRGVIALVPSADANGGLAGAADAWLLGGRGVAPGPIAVERIRGPVLTASAGQDGVWNSTVYARRIQRRLASHHVPYRSVALHYPRAGHGIGQPVPALPPTNPADVGTGGSAAADAAARPDLWLHILDFMDRLPGA